MYGGFGLSALFLVFLIPFAVRFIRWWRAEDKAALARIIRDFEDKRSLLCYKHGD